MKILRIGIVMDSPSQLKALKDSTIAFIEAAEQQGHLIDYLAPNHLWAHNGHFFAHSQRLVTHPVANTFSQNTPITSQYLHNTHQDYSWCTLQPSIVKSSSDFDVILMRKDPPFSLDYIYITYLLELAEKEGVLILNKPESLRNCNEKFFIMHFPELITDTLVSSQASDLVHFINQHPKVVLKPLDAMAGRGIFLVQEGAPNTNAILEMLTNYYTVPIMAQKFLPEIAEGDKRIILIDGHPMPYSLARVPAKNEIRANLAVGGQGKAQLLTDRDQEICAKIGPLLKARGLFWVGLDVIGDYVTEINVTSPTGIRDIEAQSDCKIARALIQALEKKLS
jgi:glutathione synthase